MTAPIHARTFKSGNSEAVRLPKGVGFGIGTDLRVERDGERVILTPVAEPGAHRREMAQLLADLLAIGAPEDGVQARDPFEFPDRPGL
jgi:antitoxin VapB